jgi:hypothetical protein
MSPGNSTAPESSNALCWQHSFAIAAKEWAQALGCILTVVGAIVFAVALLNLGIDSFIDSKYPNNESMPLSNLDFIVSWFHFGGYFVVPGWFLTCTGFGLFPFRSKPFKDFERQLS